MQHVLNAGVTAHGDVLFVVCLGGYYDDLGWRVVNFAILRQREQSAISRLLVGFQCKCIEQLVIHC